MGAPALWLANVNNPQADPCLRAISLTARALRLELREKGPYALDLSGVNPKGSGPHLVAVLRATFTWRKEIQGWGALQKAAREALISQGEDADRWMRGLDR